MWLHHLELYSLMWSKITREAFLKTSLNDWNLKLHYIDESHWVMESPIWFLTLFGGIWLLPIIYFKHLNSFSRKLLIVGCIYLVTPMLRSNMMETRVYNELNIVISVTVISVISSFVNRKSSQIKNSIIQ